MFNLEELQDDQENLNVDVDTALSPDLQEWYEEKKEQYDRTIKTNDAIGRFLLSYSLNGTGYFVARFFLIIGGSTNLFTAAILCFTICASPAAIEMQKIRINISDEGREVSGGEAIIAVSYGATIAASTTFLAMKDFLHYQHMSNNTIAGIKQDIDTIENPSIWGNDPWAIAVQGFLIVIIGIKAFWRRKNE